MRVFRPDDIPMMLRRVPSRRGLTVLDAFSKAAYYEGMIKGLKNRSSRDNLRRYLLRDTAATADCISSSVRRKWERNADLTQGKTARNRVPESISELWATILKLRISGVSMGDRGASHSPSVDALRERHGG